jgi:4-hydroxybenzoate polyprenyltransferase/phosphoserine phosphatase
MPPPADTDKGIVPLCVDLDGTVIKTDLLWESLVELLRRNPLYLFPVLLWWMRGRAYLKRQIGARVELDVTSLPYDHGFLQFLKDEKRRGRPILLVTASDRRPAERVAEHLGLFTDLLASDGNTNLRGQAKGVKLAEKFGVRGFDYAGNSTVDLPVWAQARHAIVVNGNARLTARAGKCSTVSHIFGSVSPRWQALIRALRPHQWAKNLILFVPLLTSHELSRPALALDAVLAFIAFSLCASGIYVLNDLFDLESDRHHRTKRGRPFAAGDLPLPVGLASFPLLLAGGALLASRLRWEFGAVLGGYVLLTTTYCWGLKKAPLLDVFCLAALYTIRLIAGHGATGVAYSTWLLVFSMFIFLSLALVKRFVELNSALHQNRADIRGRGYHPDDLWLVATLGSSSGYLSALVLALYVNSSDEVHRLYRHPTLLLLVCPLLLYWISRVWMLAHREKMHEDPLVFALKDPVSYLVGVLTLIVLWLATGH